MNEGSFTMQPQHNPSEAGLNSARLARLSALKYKHAALSKTIEKEQNSYVNDELVAKLKKEKLLIKEEIEGLRAVS